MPIYEYQCGACNRRFEQRQSFSDDPISVCPHCGAVDVRLMRIEGGVEVEVEDRGPGIPPAELPELFKPFTRLSTSTVSKQRSVGLGLAITRRLVEAHGGTIDVQSEVGRGSVFVIRLLRGSA